MEKFLETKEALEHIFKFFPNWITKYEINDVSTESGKLYFHTDWGVTQLNSIFPLKDKTVIELGSLEAAHTKMLHNFGAKQIVSIEGNVSNFVKCCVIKNIFQLSNITFYLEDLRYIDLSKFGQFDVCLCSGILYHLPDPQNLIAQISQVASRILINTYFAKDDFPTFGVAQVSLKGKKYHGKLQDEVDVNLPATGFQKFSMWMFKDDLIQLLHDVGYNKVKVLKDWSLDGPERELQGVTIFAEK